MEPKSNTAELRPSELGSTWVGPRRSRASRSEGSEDVVDRDPAIQAVRLTRTGGVHTLQVRTVDGVKVYVGSRSAMTEQVEDLVVENDLEQVRPDLWAAHGR